MPMSLAAQETPTVIHLWEDGAPGFEDRKDEPEIAKDWWVKNIHNPSVTVYRPPDDIATDVGIVVFPGGGFSEVVFNPEGRGAGEYLASIGITTFAVKYRLAFEEGSPYTVEEQGPEDAYRAMRVARGRAAEFGLDPEKIGVMGFSAGGLLAAMVAYPAGDGDPEAADPVDRINGKPDFQILIYPPPQAVPETVPADAPPAFVLAAIDDECCGAPTVEILQKYYEAGRSVEGHIFAQGAHAFNMGDRSDLRTISQWPDRLKDWLEDNIIEREN